MHKSAKEYMQIPCPLPILEYNKSMGGVDKLDFLISLDRIHIKSKKWTLRVIFHFVDLSVVASWLRYKKDCLSIGMRSSEQMSLLQFRYSIAEWLIKCGTNRTARILPGRPVRRSFEYRPQSDVRFDGVGHLPTWNEKRQRCKNADCIDAFSHFTCTNCKVFLCLNKNRNCFLQYHSPSSMPAQWCNLEYALKFKPRHCYLNCKTISTKWWNYVVKLICACARLLTWICTNGCTEQLHVMFASNDTERSNWFYMLVQ